MYLATYQKVLYFHLEYWVHVLPPFCHSPLPMLDLWDMVDLCHYKIFVHGYTWNYENKYVKMQFLSQSTSFNLSTEWIPFNLQIHHWSNVRLSSVIFDIKSTFYLSLSFKADSPNKHFTSFLKLSFFSEGHKNLHKLPHGKRKTEL